MTPEAATSLGRVSRPGIDIFLPDVSEGFEWVQPVDERDFDAVYQLVGQQVGADWRPIRVRRLTSDGKGRPWERAAMPWLGQNALVFREHARAAVADVLEDAGEFLELEPTDDTDRLWLFNAHQVSGTVDAEASVFVRFPSTGRVMKIERHAFHAERVAGLTAFHVPEVRSLFLTRRAVEAIRAAELTGATFRHVWSDTASG